MRLFGIYFKACGNQTLQHQERFRPHLFWVGTEQNYVINIIDNNLNIAPVNYGSNGLLEVAGGVNQTKL